MKDTQKLPMSDRSTQLMAELAERVIIADGAMGTMLQDAAPSMEDFQRVEKVGEGAHSFLGDR